MTGRADIILFGATGYTGKYCISNIHKLTKLKGRSLTWGIAGRSELKLKEVIANYQKTTDEDLSNIPIMVADVTDYESVKAMTARANVIINTCGPFRFYGESVVKACVETGTNYVDVTGEPQFMETMQLNYGKAAEEKGIYIVNACGFDSIPADLGVLFLQNNFKGIINSIETYLEAGEEPPLTPGPAINYATWESAIYGIAHGHELANIRRKLYPTRLPTFLPKQKARPSFHKSELMDCWCVPFLGSDRSVIMRTQRYLFETKKSRPAQVQTYLSLGSFYNLLLMAVFGTVFNYLVKYDFGRKLLLKYPRIFSAGLFSHENPSVEKLRKTKFSITCFGEGWSDKLLPDDDGKVPPNKRIVGRISGYNPGYGITASAITLSAIVLLTEKNKLPSRGGVFTPGVAFGETSLMEQLQENGLNFDIISDN